MGPYSGPRLTELMGHHGVPRWNERTGRSRRDETGTRRTRARPGGPGRGPDPPIRAGVDAVPDRIEHDPVAPTLRAVVDLGTFEPRLRSGSAWTPQFELPDAARLDGQGWILWCLVGLGLFADRTTLPTARDCTTEAAGMLAGLAMHRFDGNITRAAEALKTSRRALRERLRVCGMYPWDERGPETS